MTDQLFGYSAIHSGASARFFLGVARAAKTSEPKDIYTRPLFPLAVIMECEGVLAKDAGPLTQEEQRKGGVIG